MKGRKIRTLQDWREVCTTADSAESSVAGLLGTGWAASSITPPPSLELPVARIPLERAAACERRAAAVDGEEATRSLLEAFEWLSHPHPNSSPTLLRAIRRKKVALRDRIRSAGTGERAE